MGKIIKTIIKYLLMGIGIIISAVLNAYGQDIHDAISPNSFKVFCSNYKLLIICIGVVLCIVFICSILFDLKNKSNKKDDNKKLTKQQKAFIKKVPKFFEYNKNYIVYFDISFYLDGKPDPVCIKFQDKRNGEFYDLQLGTMFTNPVYQDQYVVNNVKQDIKSELLKLWFKKIPIDQKSLKCYTN